MKNKYRILNVTTYDKIFKIYFLCGINNKGISKSYSSFAEQKKIIIVVW